MPATRKRTQKGSQKTTQKTRDKQIDTDAEMFKISYGLALKNFEADTKISINVLKSLLKTSRKLIPPEVGNRLYEDVLKECRAMEEEDASIASNCDADFDAGEPQSSTLISSDVPGDVLPEVPCTDSASDYSSKQVGFAELPPRTVRSTKWKTPAGTFMNNGLGVVTPKVKPGQCMSVLRYPAQGEMAISMKGSPLLVNPVIQNSVNVQVPLLDGRVLALQPASKLNMYEVPDIDHTTRSQLLTIAQNIHSFVALTDKIAKAHRKN